MGKKYRAAAAGVFWYAADGKSGIGIRTGTADTGLFPEMQSGTGYAGNGRGAAETGCFVDAAVNAAICHAAAWT